MPKELLVRMIEFESRCNQFGWNITAALIHDAVLEIVALNRKLEEKE